MSTLAILSVAVTIFIFSVIAEDLQNFDKKAVNDEIQKAKEMIRNSSSTIRSQVYTMSPDHNIANIYFNVMPTLRNEMKENVETEVHSIVDMMFKHGGVNRTECRKYVNMYNEKKSQVLSFLDGFYLRAFENATIPILGKLEKDSEALHNLDALENRVNTCSGDQCNEISGQVIATMSEFNARTEKVLQTYRNWFEGPSVRNLAINEPVYKELQDLEHNVAKRTMDCLLGPVCEKS